MNILAKIRKGEDGVLVVGNHPAIIQSILDFDFLCGKKKPSVVGIITANRKAQKLFFGSKEILIPCYAEFSLLPKSMAAKVRFMLQLQSGRRAFESTVSFFEAFPNAFGGHIFAEHVPEEHATELIKRFEGKKLIAGPSGVGMLVPGYLKLGAIGGVAPQQLLQGKLATPGSIAVISTSGGMTNELITSIASQGKGVSFSISIGGDRFPACSVTEVLMMAEADPQTKAVVYFGELGGADEYEIVELLKAKKFTKPLVAYVAGVIDEAFDQHMQFGHAKALVKTLDESARAKQTALAKAGAVVPKTFQKFIDAIGKLPGTIGKKPKRDPESILRRVPSVLSTRRVVDPSSVPVFVQKGKLVPQSDNAFAALVLQALLGRKMSDTANAFTENMFELLVDHGGSVSGAVNTMVTARAGRDLVTSLAAGLLTIGPRFGGAINEAARTWLEGVRKGKAAAEFVEEQARAKKLIPGIGHRKYRVGIPDQRVVALSAFAGLLKKHPHYDFARAVERVTTAKSGSLIVNVDGMVAALFLDIARECDNFSPDALQELVDSEFFNALFIIPRSVGFMAHAMEQKKNDEGLFRLPENMLFERE